MEFSSILLNIGCSFAASFLFVYFLLYIYRPRVEIWPIIAENDEIDKGKIAFSFKIRNKSWFRAFDINIQLFEVITIASNNGYRNYRHIELKMKTQQWSYISKMKSRLFYPKFSDNYLIFRTYENLNQILNDQTKFLQFEITLRHGLTGISAIHIREFVRGSVTPGIFQSGRKIAIIK